jgi:mono/diheme cytochrome c family protein
MLELRESLLTTRRATAARAAGGRSAPRLLTGAVLLAVAVSVGCWEQMDDGKWFPQMKRQPAVQAFEVVAHRGQLEGFVPPEGTVPVGGSSLPDLGSLALAEQDALRNPVAASLASLKNGELLFARYCSTCHGAEGMGDGPVAASSPFAPNATGPFPLVMPINGPTSLARVFSDGHLYTTISVGRGRMPNYGRIPAMERWDLVNFLRELNGQGVRQ